MWFIIREYVIFGKRKYVDRILNVFSVFKLVYLIGLFVIEFYCLNKCKFNKWVEVLKLYVFF